MLGKDFSLVAQFRTSRGHRPFTDRYRIPYSHSTRDRVCSGGNKATAGITVGPSLRMLCRLLYPARSSALLADAGVVYLGG